MLVSTLEEKHDLLGRPARLVTHPSCCPGMQMLALRQRTPAGRMVGKHALGNRYFYHDGTGTKATQMVSIK
jgi:hypothetical protein